MKLKNVILAVLAGGALAALSVACLPKEDLGVAKLNVTPTEISLAQVGGSQEVTLLATRDWSLYTDLPTWLALSATEGMASTKQQTVKVTALANDGNDREFEVVFTIGLAKARVKVTQPGALGPVKKGDGSKENPFSVSDVIEYVQGLGADVSSPEKVYVKGKVSSVTEAYSTGFGNGTFYITDDGSASAGQFYAYRILYLGNKRWTNADAQIELGDEVIIYGNVVNYRGNTPETVQNEAYLYSHNGKTEGGGGTNTGTPEGDGTKASPYNVAAAINAVKDLSWTSNTEYETTDEVYVKGKIASIANAGSFGESGTYGNASFYISDDGSEGSAQFYCYRILYLGNKKYTSGTDIKKGDEVIICGKLMNYRGNTPETVASTAYLYSLNGETGGGGGGGTDIGTPEGDGTQASPFNVAAAINAVKDLTWTSNTEYQATEEVYVKGKIANIANAGTFGESGTYGNASFYISDDGTESSAQFYCFRILYLGNQKYTGGTDIKKGDEVIVCGKLMNYKGNTPETVAGAAFLYSLNGTTETETPTPSVTITSFKQTQTGISASWSCNMTDPGFQWYLYKGEVKDANLVASDYTEQASLSYDVTLEVGATYWFSVTADSDDVEDYIDAEPVSLVAQDMSQGGGGSNEVEIDLTSKTTWTADTDATYGKGFSATVEDVKVGLYKYKSTSDPRTPDEYSARVYKSSVFIITAPSGKTIKSVSFIANDYDNGKYCVDLTVLEGGSGTLKANVSTLSIGPWEGSASRLVLQAAAAQARLQSMKVVLE